jgi:hypothetical protein
LKKGEKIIFKDYWDGCDSKAYTNMKARDEIEWWLSFRESVTRENCEHRISSSWKKQSNEPVTSRNCLRIDAMMPEMDKCSLKMPSYWSDAIKERSHILIINGDLSYFGECGGNCPYWVSLF